MINQVAKLPLQKQSTYYLSNPDFYVCHCGHPELAEVLGIYNNWALLLQCTKPDCGKKWYACSHCKKARTKMSTKLQITTHQWNHSKQAKRAKECVIASKWVVQNQVAKLPLETKDAYKELPNTELYFCECGHGSRANVTGTYNRWAFHLCCSNNVCEKKWYACSICERARVKMRTKIQLSQHNKRQHKGAAKKEASK